MIQSARRLAANYTTKPTASKSNAASSNLSVRARENEKATLQDFSPSKMHLVVVVTSILYLGQINCSTRSEQFEQVHDNVQFKNLEIVRAMQVKSQLQCAVACLETGSGCGSFLIDALQTCRLSVLRISKPVKNPELVFNISNGTNIFGKVSVQMPSGNIALLDTLESSYIIGLSPVTWHAARDLCPLYGHGFQLASITSADEQDLLRSWLQPLVQRRQPVFVSGTDEQHESCWLWANPEISRLDAGFTDWRTAEPNNNDGNENCLAVDYKLKLNDIRCHRQSKYLCKRSARDGLIIQPSIDDVHSSSLC